MRRAIMTIVLVGAAVLFFSAGGARWLLFHTLFRGIGVREDALKSVAVAQLAARELGVLCQTCRAHPDWFDDAPPLAPAWTPDVLLKHKPTWVTVEPDGARVEFGGGFHHFGYTLADVPTDGADATYVLRFYSEDSGGRDVARVTL